MKTDYLLLEIKKSICFNKEGNILRKLSLLCILTAFLMFIAIPSCADAAISPGEVSGDYDVLVFEENETPPLLDISQDIGLSIQGESIDWSSPDFEVGALIIRSLTSEGSVTGIISNDTDFYLEDPDGDEVNDSAEIEWSFNGSRKVLSGYFSLVSGDVDEVDSCDISVMKLENGSRYEIWFGTKGEIEESLYWGSVEDVLTDVNLGPVVVSPDQELVMTLTNWGNETVEAHGDWAGEPILAYIKDWESESSDRLIQVDMEIDPSNGLGEFDGTFIYSGFGIPLLGENSWDLDFGFGSGVISFDLGSSTGAMDLRWLAAEPFVVTEDLELGIFTGVDSSDLAAVGIDVEKVITSSDIDPEDISASFPQTLSTEYISRFEMSVEMSPDYTTIYSGDVVMPTILQLPISFFEGLEEYNDSIFQTIGEQTNTPYPLGDEWDPEAVDRDALMSALRQYLTLTKSWDDGFSEEVRLDGPGFKDAVHMNLILGQYEGNENTSELLLRMAVLLVDSDLQGIETVELNGQTMLVIYDGNRDGVFTDPLDLTASVPENGGGGATTGGSSGGCALGFLTPIAMLLIAPLLVLLKK